MHKPLSGNPVAPIGNPLAPGNPIAPIGNPLAPIGLPIGAKRFPERG